MMGKIVMRLRQYFDKEPEERNIQRARSKSAKVSIAAHRSFVPMLTLWGAALLGLIVIVLPASATDRIATLSGLGAMGGGAKYVFAGVAALLGAAVAFVIAAAFRKRSHKSGDDTSVVSAVSSRRMRTINPAADLGSESLDAPLENMPFGVGDEDAEIYPQLADESAADNPDTDTKDAEQTPERQPTLGELSQRGYDPEDPKKCFAAEDDKTDQPGFTRRHFKTALIESCEGAAMEKPAPMRATSQDAAQTAESEIVTEAAPSLLKQKPRALDLGEFAEVPGRNAVWVEESAVKDATPSPISEPRPDRTTSALEKLRQTPPENLSLVQMVERFAGALHDRQQADSANASKNAGDRDASLAEALKALTLFTERGFDQPIPTGAATSENELGQTERELRAALVKLQSLRGAA